MAALYDKRTVSSAKIKLQQTGGFGGIQRRKKANQGERAAVECLNFKILSGSFTIMLRGRCRTSASELMCKHGVLPEAAEAGPFTFPFSQREPSGRCRHNVASDWLNPKRFLLKDSVRASWFKEEMLYETHGTWQDVLCPPAGLWHSRLCGKAKCILLLYVQVSTEKWVPVTQQRKSWK